MAAEDFKIGDRVITNRQLHPNVGFNTKPGMYGTVTKVGYYVYAKIDGVAYKESNLHGTVFDAYELNKVSEFVDLLVPETVKPNLPKDPFAEDVPNEPEAVVSGIEHIFDVFSAAMKGSTVRDWHIDREEDGTISLTVTAKEGN